MLTIGVSAAVAAVTAPLVPSSAHAAGPQIIDLGVLPGTTSSVATDLNEHGVIVGNSSGNSASRAVRWKNGTMTDLGTLGGPTASATAINNNGWIVGNSNVDDYGTRHGFLWRPGQPMLDLDSLGSDSFAADINDAGVVIGQYYDSELGFRGFRWENGVMTTIENQAGGPDPDLRRFIPKQITGSGLIVGESQGQAARWVDGTVTLVGVPGAYCGGANAAGEVTASASLPTERAFVWRADGTTRTLQMPSGTTRAWPTSINADGDAVGYGTSGHGTISRPVYWSETGVAHSLPSLVPDGHSVAVRVNNASKVIGWSHAADGTTRAVLWSA
ncbi:hypothetical protein Cme02nite_03350 [Catellatospora methionotrophica]|uniref:Uncharacterized protein n=1 Tax=Catellatospora methionotrophica TaxID=121620 RepID=A0A8J3PD42_9ACTN|nr:hypothetical protein [Catellatospora methionotrophica]GIG12003.1 hypothetical protein Cme02nite_03350 [Catellatospora methionotrophica]